MLQHLCVCEVTASEETHLSGVGKHQLWEAATCRGVLFNAFLV